MSEMKILMDGFHRTLEIAEIRLMALKQDQRNSPVFLSLVGNVSIQSKKGRRQPTCHKFLSTA